MEKIMGKKGRLRITTIPFIIFLGAAFLFALASDMDALLAELKRLKIEVAGPATKQIDVQLPPKLSDANWGLKKIICEQGGYDLSAYAGKKVTLSCFSMREKYNSKESLNVWVVSSGDNIACVYKAVGEGSSMAPGVFSVENPKAKEQSK
jgi:hypothetical protein